VYYLDFVFSSASRAVWRKVSAALGAVLLFTLAACNGTAVVTLTSTPSSDTFLTYRVGLTSVELQKSNGRTTATILPSSTTVDLAQLVNLSEIIGAVGINGGDFKQAIVTLDYSSAQIVYDDGSIDGVALTPLDASGQALGAVTLTLYLDPSNGLKITRKSSSRLSLDFNLAASNIVNVAQKTVTVMPLMAASASPIDTKTVHLRGPLAEVDTRHDTFTTGVAPLYSGTGGLGQLKITPSSVTTYEINGTPATGTAGFNQLAALSTGVTTEAFGTLTSSTSSTTGGNTSTTSTTTTTTTTTTGTTTPTTSSTDVSFAATEVLAGSSAQGSGFDRITGVVSGRSGNTVNIEDGTLLGNDGTNTFILGTATISIGANTQVTQFGAGSVQANGTQEISVGSVIDAYGTASPLVSGNVTLDASAGRVRLNETTASGLVTVQGTGTLTLNLAYLGGRSVAAFDFAGTGTSPSYDASASSYQVTTGALILTNATMGTPVEATGFVTSFGAAPPNLSATTLLDTTTIDAELVLDWSPGTPAPFASYNSSQIVVDSRNSGIGARHEIELGAQTINIVGIASDPQIVPDSAAANAVFTIGHSVSGTFENFITYSAFITQLQKELNGTAVATGLTAFGPYATATYTLSADSITIFLNN
jgi:hypothetical protein